MRDLDGAILAVLQTAGRSMPFQTIYRKVQPKAPDGADYSSVLGVVNRLVDAQRVYREVRGDIAHYGIKETGAPILQERKPGERQRLVLQALRDHGQAIGSAVIWRHALAQGAQISRENIENCLASMTKQGQVIRQGDPRNYVYTLPVRESEPMRTNGTEPHPAPTVTIALPPPPPGETTGEKTEVVLDAVYRSLRVGTYTINAAAWTIADDHGTWLELLTTALEIDPNSRHPRTKKLRFEQVDEVRRVRAWLAQQTGEPLTAETEAAERDREAALALAEAAEQRAKDAERRAAEAEKKLAAIRAQFGGL